MSFVVAFFALTIVVNAFVAVPFDFKFWRESLAQVSVYAGHTGGDDRQGATHLGVALLIAALVFGYRAMTRRPSHA